MRVFIETTSNKDDHGGKGWEYGKYLWSPLTSTDGKKIYELMLEPKENDQVLHFYKIKNKKFIHGRSLVENECLVTNDRPNFSEWNWSDKFYKIKLKRFENPIEIKDFITLFDSNLRDEK